MKTARLCGHARERCSEMGISTKVAKKIVEHAEVKYPGTPHPALGPTHIAMWSGTPEYCVVVLGESGRDYGDESPLVMTVLFNTTEYYQRNGTTYVTKGA